MECWASGADGLVWSAVETKLKKESLEGHLPTSFVPTLRRSKLLFKHFDCF